MRGRDRVKSTAQQILRATKRVAASIIIDFRFPLPVIFEFRAIPWRIFTISPAIGQFSSARDFRKFVGRIGQSVYARLCALYRRNSRDFFNKYILADILGRV